MGLVNEKLLALPALFHPFAELDHNCSTAVTAGERCCDIAGRYDNAGFEGFAVSASIWSKCVRNARRLV
jgi:hypothetical protein